VYFRGRRLPASYANFYIANKLVLAPIFSDPNDRAALNTLATVFPDREIVGIYCRDLIWGLGALHCMTQQQPA
jgi:agmatine deiminase